MEGQSVGKSASAANVSGEKESNNKEESNAGLNANGSGGASSENGSRKAPYKRSYNSFSYRGGRRFYSNNKDGFAGGNSGSGGFGRNNFRRRRRRVCEFCAEGLKTIDYKDASRLSKFLTDRAKIVTRRSAGTCAQHQRELATALKRARCMALLPYCNR